MLTSNTDLFVANNVIGSQLSLRFHTQLHIIHFELMFGISKKSLNMLVSYILPFMQRIVD